MENVSWNDCAEFLEKLSAREGRGYRLPTEAEWEYACRAGTSTPFSFGVSLNGTEANCDGNYPYGTAEKGPYLSRTCPVGSYAANAWGLHDMHGNVWEWCQDWYARDAYQHSNNKDPEYTNSGDSRVLRGGSWLSNCGNCRAAFRRWAAPGLRLNNFGFRLAFRLD